MNFSKFEKMEEPIITNEVISPLEGQELEQVRYSQLAEDLLGKKDTNKAEIRFQWKPRLDENFNEDEDMVLAEIELEDDGSLLISTEAWNGRISPDGKISGEIPSKLINFLTYNKKEYDIEFDGEKKHKIDYVKEGFGKGGQSISTTYKYE